MKMFNDEELDPDFAMASDEDPFPYNIHTCTRNHTDQAEAIRDVMSCFLSGIQLGQFQVIENLRRAEDRYRLQDVHLEAIRDSISDRIIKCPLGVNVQMTRISELHTQIYSRFGLSNVLVVPAQKELSMRLLNTGYGKVTIEMTNLKITNYTGIKHLIQEWAEGLRIIRNFIVQKKPECKHSFKPLTVEDVLMSMPRFHVIVAENDKIHGEFRRDQDDQRLEVYCDAVRIRMKERTHIRQR